MLPEHRLLIVLSSRHFRSREMDLKESTRTCSRPPKFPAFCFLLYLVLANHPAWHQLCCARNQKVRLRVLCKASDSLPAMRASQVREWDCNPIRAAWWFLPLGNRGGWQPWSLLRRAGHGIQPIDGHLVFLPGCPPLFPLFEELETLRLLNPLREQGDFSRTYFYHAVVQTGRQRNLAFHFSFS